MANAFGVVLGSALVRRAVSPTDVRSATRLRNRCSLLIRTRQIRPALSTEDVAIKARDP